MYKMCYTWSLMQMRIKATVNLSCKCVFSPAGILTCSLNVEPGRRVALQSSATNKPRELANNGGLQGWSRSDHDFTGARRHLSSEPRTLWSLMGRCRGAGPPDLLLFCCQTASQQLRRIKTLHQKFKHPQRSGSRPPAAVWPV